MTSLRPALWDYALSVYSAHKETLLQWQADGAGVNDILLCGFARHHQWCLDWGAWQAVESGRPRQVLRRVRHLRFQLPPNHPTRTLALQWELALEQWDLALLADCLRQQDRAISVESAVEALCQHWQITRTHALHELVQRLGS
ncbi:DUF2390 domain-containing protein [Saccharospirillum sp. MSK14-1]|uniref:DUF2390 domain-containing protein n=1 Tax=Saccharospirillum sp. MSK14-1 TaxID=1897632 RepID=UPI0011B275BD|nr:DUF2390 domain-containing protein [Saccharospirillum sp. MSK14-1]